MVLNLNALFTSLTTILIIFISSTSQHSSDFKLSNQNIQNNQNFIHNIKSDNLKINKHLKRIRKSSLYDQQRSDQTFTTNTQYQQTFNHFEDDQFTRSQFVHFTPLEPQFDDNIEKNLTVPIGSSAYLQCRIKNLGDRMVSWVRSRDLQILTFSNVTYTSDQRFKCIHIKNTDDWTLQIESVSKNDIGFYECQISLNAESKLSSKVYLNVIDVQASILEGDTVQVRKDGAINLNCIINYSANQTNALILWYHNSSLLNYNKDVITKSKLLYNKETSTFYLHSNMRINNVDSSYSGLYTCKFHTTTNVKFIITSYPTTVNVLNSGENPTVINYMNNYNKHRALKDEYGNLFDNSSFNLKPFYLIFFNSIFYLFIRNLINKL